MAINIFLSAEKNIFIYFENIFKKIYLLYNLLFKFYIIVFMVTFQPVIHNISTNLWITEFILKSIVLQYMFKK